MPTSSLLTVALGLSLGQVPYQSNGSYTPGAPAGAETGLQASATGGQYGHEEMFPYDAYDNWVHGHFQEIPAYGGYHFFRPYNYKHVLSQSQTSAGWGNSPQLPYSHEYFWRRAQRGGQPESPYAAPQYGPQYAPSMSPPPGPVYSHPGSTVPLSQPIPVMPPPGLGPTSSRTSGRSATVAEYGESGPALIDSAVYNGPADSRTEARRQLFRDAPPRLR